MKETYQFFDQKNHQFDLIKASTELTKNSVDVKFHISPKLSTDEIKLESQTILGQHLSRKIGLWQKTCFELFIKNKFGDDYYEINFSPKHLQWNAFYFSSYRSPLTETNKILFNDYSYQNGVIAFKLMLPEGEFSLFPKVVLFQEVSNTYTYLSHLPHPKTGPDFHIFSVS